MPDVMTSTNIALEPDVLEQVQQLAEVDGKMADQVVNDATNRELARRWLERVGRDARVLRGNMTDEEVEAAVDQTIHADRAEQRGR